MLKINLKKAHNETKTSFIIYNSITRIPFTFTIGDQNLFRNLIYARNLSNNNNFIEFRFNENDCSLYDLALVSIQDHILFYDAMQTIKIHKGYYLIELIKEDSLLVDNAHVEIFRHESTLSITINPSTDSNSLEYYSISDNFIVGIDNSNYLKSIIIVNLNKEEIKQIIGY